MLVHLEVADQFDSTQFSFKKNLFKILNSLISHRQTLRNVGFICGF